jgi:hypothetical protein
VGPRASLNAAARYGKMKNRLLLQRNEPRFLGHLARSLVSIRTKLSQLTKDTDMPRIGSVWVNSLVGRDLPVQVLTH